MTDLTDLAAEIERLWQLPAEEAAAGVAAVDEAVDLLDRGVVRCAERDGDAWVAREWAKKAILLYFRLRRLEPDEAGPFRYFDKVPLKRNYEELERNSNAFFPELIAFVESLRAGDESQPRLSSAGGV